MSIEDDADRATFLDVAEFGETVQIGGNDVNGIFDNAYLSAEAAEAGIAGTKPAFVCRSSDVSGITVGATMLARGGKAYLIVSAEPDGADMTVLVLQRQLP